MAAVDVLGGPAPAPAPLAVDGELKPPFLTKLFYAFGQAIESGYLIVSGFVFFYYTAVLGLSGTMVGIALAISMAIDAVMDPLIGSISDNLRTRFGRRLPLMVLGAPLTGLALWMLFSPPVGLQPLILFLWLVFAKMALRAVASLYNLPYAALGAEMASGYAERASVVAYRGVFGVVISIAVTILALSVFFAGPGGLQERSYYTSFGAGMGALLFACGAVCCLGVWNYARRLPQPTTPGATLLGGLAHGAPEVFRNASFRSLFLSALLFWIAAGVNGSLNNHAYTFVWRMTPQMIQPVNISFYLAILLGVPLTRPLLNRFEKKTVIMLGLGVVVVSMTVLHGLRALGLFTLTGEAVVPWLMSSVFLGGVGIGFLVVAYPAMMADAADEHEVLFGVRREGLYFAGLGFASKAATGFGQMAAGFALDALRFPETAGHAAGTPVPEHALRMLILAWGPFAAIFAVGSALALLPYAVSRARHAELAAAVKLKRAKDLSAGRSS